MADWEVVTYRDRGIGGHRYDGSESSCAESQLSPILRKVRYDNGFDQLGPVSDLDTSPVPIVSACWLPDSSRWVFVLRGVGGLFGAAGTLQLVLTPKNSFLRESWPRFFERVSSEGIFSINDPCDAVQGSQVCSGSVAPWESARLAHPVEDDDVIGAVLSISRASCSTDDQASCLTDLGVPPVKTIELYSRMLSVLPERVARSLVWSTCHVISVSPVGRPRIVSGSWPEVFQRSWEGGYGIFRKIASAANKPAEDCVFDAADERALRWYLAQATPSASDSFGSSTISEFLKELRLKRPLDLSDFDWAYRDPKVDPKKLRELVLRIPRESPDLLCRYLSVSELQDDIKVSLVKEALEGGNASAKSRIQGMLRAEAFSGSSDCRIGRLVKKAVASGFINLLLDVFSQDVTKPSQQEKLRFYVESLGFRLEDAPEFFPYSEADALTLVEEGKAQVALKWIMAGPKSTEKVLSVLGRLKEGRKRDLAGFLIVLLDSFADQSEPILVEFFKQGCSFGYARSLVRLVRKELKTKLGPEESLEPRISALNRAICSAFASSDSTLRPRFGAGLVPKLFTGLCAPVAHVDTPPAPGTLVEAAARRACSVEDDEAAPGRREAHPGYPDNFCAPAYRLDAVQQRHQDLGFSRELRWLIGLNAVMTLLLILSLLLQGWIVLFVVLG